MPVISKDPIKYELPFIGQVFQKEQQDGRWEYGIVLGLIVQRVKREVDGVKREVVESWRAHVTTGFRDFRQEVAHDKTYQSTEQWHPAPAEMQAHGALLAALEARIQKQQDWIERTQGLVVAPKNDVLVERIAQMSARLASLENDRLAEEEASEGLKTRLASLEARANTPLVVAHLPIEPAAAGEAPAAAPRPVQGERPRRGASA